MTTKQKQRLVFLVILLSGIGLASLLVLYSLQQNLLYFYTPSQVKQGQAPQDRTIRVGGMVVTNSLVYDEDNPMTIRFSVTDYQEQLSLVYTGFLPDLFAEGQGTVASGRLNKAGIFVADTVLAKHDENYMPPEVADALKQNKPEPMALPSLQ